MQKINFIPPFSYEILQRYYKLAILGTLGIPSYDHQTLDRQLVEHSFLQDPPPH